MPIQEVLEDRYIDKIKLYTMLARVFGPGNFRVDVSAIIIASLLLPDKTLTF
jgi:hypothetical protein